MSSTVTLERSTSKKSRLTRTDAAVDEHAAPPVHRLGVEADLDDHHLSPLGVAPALTACMTASDRRGAA
jgi:hypothetical protein